MQHFCLLPTGWHLMTLSLTSLISSCVVSSTHPTWVSIRPGRRPSCGAPGTTMTSPFATEPGAARTTKTPSFRTHRFYFISFLQLFCEKCCNNEGGVDFLNNPVYLLCFYCSMYLMWRNLRMRYWYVCSRKTRKPHWERDEGKTWLLVSTYTGSAFSVSLFVFHMLGFGLPNLGSCQMTKHW